ncbi:5-histidylcysteine sulfoxide synthase [Psychromonas sp. MME2]|uniref:5-histidylcysteine sulfoxide synthase n=1 Tax=Psychromonas sp. MME2 TaxID=3231033 RepID=UPI00339C61D1
MIKISNGETVLLTGKDKEQKRAAIKSYFETTWALYESLFSLINNDDAYFKRAEPLRHPLIFYFGHTATFFINKLKLGKFIDARINENFESMFAIGVDEMSWDDLDQTHYNWPSVDAVRHYRALVKQRVTLFIDTMPLTLPIAQSSAAWVIIMAIEHERIHLETSSVIIRQLPITDVTCQLNWSACPDTGSAADNCLINITGKKITLGKNKDDDRYGWDNEYGQQTFTVDDFKASKYLVSNQEYLSFVEDDGYNKAQYWTQEGKNWLAYTKAQMPRFWFLRNQQIMQRNLSEEIPLPLNWPVEVNQLEAKAFCNWKAEKCHSSIRLMTEAEWYLLRENIPYDAPYGEHVPGNTQLAYYASSCPINIFKHNGLFDIVGNVWQWTETAMDGFSGFAIDPLYDDFSTPTFDGKHNLIKGGSWISTGNETLRSSRYAFRRHFYQHAGFRYVQSDHHSNNATQVNIYESDQLIAQYLEFHYGATYFAVENYSINAVKQALQAIRLTQCDKALDIGCSVGRATFELAKTFTHVDGIDFSARFIQQAYQLCERGEKRYCIPKEGDLVEYKSISLKQLGYQGLTDKVRFMQGDATNLKPSYTGYDLIYAANLIDRLSEPKLFLDTIQARLNEHGYLVITSPYTWLEDYTAKDKWLGGVKVNGENYSTLDGLHAALDSHFNLIHCADIPFVIRETARKFQHTVTQMTIWQKCTKT